MADGDRSTGDSFIDRRFGIDRVSDDSHNEKQYVSPHNIGDPVPRDYNPDVDAVC
jgi:hypothetical protein